MSSRWRPYLLGILGLAALTFPFLWLQLAPNFTNATIGVAWAPSHGLQFFGDLSPVFVIAFLIWLGVQANRRFGWDQALAANPVWQRAARAWTQRAIDFTAERDLVPYTDGECLVGWLW